MCEEDGVLNGELPGKRTQTRMEMCKASTLLTHTSGCIDLHLGTCRPVETTGAIITKTMHAPRAWRSDSRIITHLNRPSDPPKTKLKMLIANANPK